jgi:hypothetical protein
MENESSNAGSQTWTEGGPIESMSPDEARAEIKAIENDPSFFGEGKAYWPRQQMLRRRIALCDRAGPEDPERAKVRFEDRGMYDTLKALGITKESFEADEEKFEARDAKEALEKAKRDLELRLGGEKPAEEALKLAHGVLKRFGKPQDLVFLESSGLGNDVEMIEILAQLAKKLDRGGKRK